MDLRKGLGFRWRILLLALRGTRAPFNGRVSFRGRGSRVSGLSCIAGRVVRHRGVGVEERGMEQKIYRERNRAWNRVWKKRFGDGSVIKVDEVAFGQGRALVNCKGDVIRTGFVYGNSARACVFRGSAYRGAGVAHKE